MRIPEGSGDGDAGRRTLGASVSGSRVTGASPPTGQAIEVRLLGPVAVVEADGSVFEPPSVTQRRLLAILALEAGHTVRADALGEALDVRGGALRKVVSRLRAVVGPALQTTATGYLLDVDVDAIRFTTLVTADRLVADRRARLVEGLGWWHGDALDEFCGETWAIAHATQLESLRAAAVEEVADHLIEADEAVTALALLEPHTARHPMSDAANALLVRALAAAGRSTHALRVAHLHRTTLRDTAGLSPGPAFGEVERRVAGGWDGRNGTPGVPPAVPSLRTPATRWVGSTLVLDGIAADLSAHRVVTLTGPGGVGKTRASIEVARRSAHRFPDGVVVIELAPLTEGASVPEAVASGIGVATRSGLSVTASIVERLSGSRRLLVLDNAEHVVASTAALVRGIVGECPDVTVLVTSREPLGVRGERVVTIRPLTIDDGVELFCERALDVDDSAHFGAQERDAIATICRRLDGLPLALELAAARTRSIGPGELSARLGRRFEALGTARDGEYHQRTLWATIDWSYRLLDPGEQSLFEQLSVFHGSFDLGAVERVGVVAGLDPDVTATLLGGLVDRSMVVSERHDGSLRYRLLDTLRQFAEVQLAERGAAEEVALRHVHHYVEFTEATNRRWFGRDQVAADDEFGGAWDNLRAAHAWAVAHQQHALAERLVLATIAHSHSRMRSEHGDWCATSVRACDTDGYPPSAALLGWAAWWAMIAGHLTTAIDWAGRGIALELPLDDPGAAVCRSVKAFSLWTVRRPEEAAGLVTELEAVLDRLPPWEAYTAERALFSFSSRDGFGRRARRIAAITSAIGAPSLLASSRFYEGSAAMAEAVDTDEAARLHLEGIVLARTAHAELAECQNLQGLLDATVAGEEPDAVEVCIEAITRLYELRYWLYLWRVLDGAACTLARLGRTEAAAALLGHLDQVAAPWRTEPRATTRRLVASAGWGPAEAERGVALDRDEVVRLALTELRRCAR